ncbi:unnamed protein product [Lampetra planeri]
MGEGRVCGPGGHRSLLACAWSGGDALSNAPQLRRPTFSALTRVVVRGVRRFAPRAGNFSKKTRKTIPDGAPPPRLDAAMASRLSGRTGRRAPLARD